MRDPCLLWGPDGIFRMVWTTDWDMRGIGCAHSKDFVHWFEQKPVEVVARCPYTDLSTSIAAAVIC